jgi:flagellar FliL protein
VADNVRPESTMQTPDTPSEAQPAEKPAAKPPIVRWVLISIGLFVLATLSQAIAPLITEPVKTSLAARAAAKATAAAEAAVNGGIEGDAEEEEEEDAEPLPEPFYQPLNPPMVVNFANDPSGFMQVAVQVMARDKETIDVVKANEPAVRNALIMLYAGKTRDDIASREGKEKLRAETLAEVQNVLAPYAGESTVEDVYFTSIIAQ